MRGMPLDQGWRTVVRFVVRFSIAGFAVGIFSALGVSSKEPGILTEFLLFCPAMWFVPHYSWRDAPWWLLFILVPIVNSALYAMLGAAIGALFAGLTSKPSSGTSVNRKPDH